MIITCPSCNKKFEIDEALIPSEGREVQCGSCEHQWFYNKELRNEQNSLKNIDVDSEEIQRTTVKTIQKPENKILNEFKKDISKTVHRNEAALVKYEKKTNFTIGNFLGYILVFIISFIALVIILDTLKSPLSNYFPDLEIFLYNLFEILKDIFLFIKDFFRNT